MTLAEHTAARIVDLVTNRPPRDYTALLPNGQRLLVTVWADGSAEFATKPATGAAAWSPSVPMMAVAK